MITGRLRMGICTTLVLACAGAAAEKVTVWTFDDDPVGATPPGFSSEVGLWGVVKLDDGAKPLMQMKKSPGSVFNVALATATKARDLDLSVRLRPIAGVEDQGGGLVWRARDAKNYYIARFNPLEDNFRVYTVVAGKRTQLQSVDIKHHDGWYAVRVRMRGDHVTCDLDGKTLLDVRDTTFPDAGRIGLWTKADAQTQFDDLKLVQDD